MRTTARTAAAATRRARRGHCAVRLGPHPAEPPEEDSQDPGSVPAGGLTTGSGGVSTRACEGEYATRCPRPGGGDGVLACLPTTCDRTLPTGRGGRRLSWPPCSPCRSWYWSTTGSGPRTASEPSGECSTGRSACSPSPGRCRRRRARVRAPSDAVRAGAGRGPDRELTGPGAGPQLPPAAPWTSSTSRPRPSGGPVSRTLMRPPGV